MTNQTFLRQYLYHPDGRVVWAQSSAYQDTPGLAMWCDLVLKPARERSSSKRWALVWDNVKAHAVESVRKVFEEAGITLFDFPVYMTDLLQPVDIVPNGPLKSHTRSARIDKLYSYFSDWRQLAEEAQAEHSPLPPFRPPASTMAAGISLISRIFATRFTEADYIAGVQRCFVSVGLSPGADGKYAMYTSHERAHTCAKAFRGQKMPKNELNGSALLDDVSFDKPSSCSTATVDDATVELEDTGASGAAVRSAAESSDSGSD